MTPEEKYEIESRLSRANQIESQIEEIKTAVENINNGRFYLNAGRFQHEHELVAGAIKLIEPRVREAFANKIEELKQELEAL